MRLTDDDLKTYVTNTMAIVVPSYLRQQRGMLLFKAPAIAVDGRSLKMVSATAHDTPNSRRILVENWKALPKCMNWLGVTQTVDRCGPVNWVPNGFEIFILTTSEKTSLDVPFDYSVIFDDVERPIEVRVLGYGQQPRFEELCRRIVLSVVRK